MTHNNYRNAVIIGYTQEAIRLKEVFENRKDYGYRFQGFFSDKKQNSEVKGRIDDLKPFIIENKIDEIYCSLNEISNEKLKELVEFADDNKKTIKFIPDTKDIFSKNLKIDYYELFPVLSLQKTQLHNPAIKGLKRFFDILFSISTRKQKFPLKNDIFFTNLSKPNRWICCINVVFRPLNIKKAWLVPSLWRRRKP